MAKIRPRIKVTERDRGWRKLRREVFRVGQHVTVGVHGEDEGRKGGQIGNVELATVHEFGSEREGIPERSFIRYTIDTNILKYRRLVHALGQQVYRTRITTAQALEILGLKVASDMRRTFDRTPAGWPPIEASTAAGREFGGTKPLVDRKELQRSVKHKVFA